MENYNNRYDKKFNAQAAPANRSEEQDRRSYKNERSDRTERDTGRSESRQRVVWENDLYERQSI